MNGLALNADAMTVSTWLPPSILLASALTGCVVINMPDRQARLRAALNLAGAMVKLGLVAIMVAGTYVGQDYTFRMSLGPHLELLLRSSTLTLLFAALSAVLWLLTTLYAIGYFARSPDQARFFGFFSWCVTATAGVALAGNLFTLLVFYELLTLTTYPLVVHRGTAAALAAGRTYLRYTLTGGAVLLLATAALNALDGPVVFERGGALARSTLPDATLTVLGALLLLGFGVKAALVPLHGWLPRAMVAPAPVSALLHAVAVVKAGAFGIVRVLYEVLGMDLAQRLGLTAGLLAMAAFTILYGSLRALAQDDLKRRLAFSTVSQVAYIAFGAALGGTLATVGGVVHLVHQGLMKVTLFFAAGVLAERLGIHAIRELNGIGRQMPLTMLAFSVGALGMIGVPPAAGFVSKWYLGTGAMAAGHPWAIAVLATSAALNAAYFLPVLYRAWFAPTDVVRPAGPEASLSLLIPPLTTAATAFAVGLLAAMPLSPLRWTELIVATELLP